MTEMIQNRSGVYVIPEDYDEAQYEISEEQKIFEQFAEEAKDNDSYSKITVSRVPMNKRGQRGAQKLTFLFEAGIDEYDYTQLLSYIRDHYGSGYYKIQARNDKGQLKLNKTVVVEAPQTETEHASANNNAGELAQISQTLAGQQTEMREMMRDFVTPQTQGTDLVDAIVKLSPILVPLMSKLFEKPEQKSIVEQLTEIQMLRDTFGLGNNEQNGEANLYSLLGETVKHLGAPIAAAIAAGQEAGTVDEHGVVRPQLPEPEATPENGEQAAMQLAELKENLNFLLENAKAGTKPKELAEMLVQNMTDEQADQMFDFISAPDVIDKMAMLNGEVREHRVWFDALADRLIHLLSEPELHPGDEPELTDDESGASIPASDAVAGDSETETENDPGNTTGNSSGGEGNPGDA